MIVTQDQKKIKRHLFNPFSFIETKIFSRKIYRNGDKLIIRYNAFVKNKQIFHRFHKRTATTHGISLNLKNGDITFFTDKLARKNCFIKIKGFIKDTLLKTDNNTLKYDMGISNVGKFNESIFNMFQSEFDNEVFISTIFDELNKIDGFNVSEHSLKNKNPHTLYLSLVEVLLHFKKIKAPNNYIALMEHWYPTVKFLRKNDNKLILSILDRLEIKSKKLNKIFHENENISVEFFPIISVFFGKDDLPKYIGNIDNRYFTLPLGTNEYKSFNAQYHTHYQLNSKEKTNLLKLLNNTIDEIINNKISFFSLIHDIGDHFRMVSSLKEYYPNVQLNSITRETFNVEHQQLSKMFNLIAKGFTTEFIFEEGMVEYFEKPIFHNNTFFYPKLLRIDSEYVEEGNHMHHCVGSYSSNKTSIIISLRQDELNGHERITSQYNVERRDVIQSRYFCNANPPDIFKEPLIELGKRVSKYPGSLKYIEFKERPLLINGIEVKPVQQVTQYAIF